MERRAWVVLGVIFGGLFLSLFGFLLLAFFAINSADTETASFGRGDAVGVIEIEGVISTSDKTMKDLRRFEQDDSVKAILVRINSPGGAVAPSQEVYSELRRIGGKKKVVCSMGDLAASGGYYIAAGCQTIVANPGTLTGSIGVISQSPYLGDLAELAHFRMRTFKSGKLKDVGNPFREMTPEEEQYFRSMLESVHEQFIVAVAEGRNLPVEEVRPWADGRVLTGLQAKEAKLVDQLGNFNDAVRLTASLAGLGEDVKLRYPPEERTFSLGDFVAEGGRAMMSGMLSELETRMRPGTPRL